MNIFFEKQKNNPPRPKSQRVVLATAGSTACAQYDAMPNIPYRREHRGHRRHRDGGLQ